MYVGTRVSCMGVEVRGQLKESLGSPAMLSQDHTQVIRLGGRTLTR